MTTLASAEDGGSPFLAFLREELTPRPGRLGSAVRIATCAAIVTATTMLYQIPEPAYAAYIVFFLGRGDTAVTVRTGIAGFAAVTLATVLSLFFYSLDAGEPALRLPLMTLSTFLGMFLLHTMAIGPIAFLAGFILVVTQSLIDVLPNLEALTRLVLWLWVVVMLPNAVTVLANLLTGSSATDLARRSAIDLLDTLASSIERGDLSRLVRASADALELVEMRERAELLDHGLRMRGAGDVALIETLDELISLALLLPAKLAQRVRENLADASRACSAALAGGPKRTASMPSVIDHQALSELDATERPVVLAMSVALHRLAAGIAERGTARPAAAAKHEAGLFVPDAFTNPEHVRFALKTTLAAMAAYIIYTGADWPDIRTALITCFFVAQGTLGETLHKLTLRLSGAAIGAVAGGLCIVYVLPQLTDIGDLCLLVVAVSIPFAWVATSSERLAYAGMQMALAFYLGVLQGYGPATDLTVLRDRMVGILLGNLLMSLVFGALWPMSAETQARRALASAMRALAALLRDRTHPAAGRRLAVARAVGRARTLLPFGMFETELLPSHRASGASARLSLDHLDHVAAAVFVVAEHRAFEASFDALDVTDTTMADWLSSGADCLSAGDRMPPTPDAQTARDALASLPVAAPIEARSALEARLLLQAEIAGAVAHASA